MSHDLLDRLARRLAPHGLLCRGGFHPRPSDGVPRLANGAHAATVVMIGNTGGRLWPAFTESPEYRDRHAHALDGWTRRIVDAVANELAANAWYPSDGPPYLPFQRWAMHADTVWLSPLQLLIHPEYGLWHAYRAALAFATRMELPPRPACERPCDTCAERPCLSACPVDAFSAAGYAAESCRTYLRTPEGDACLVSGCMARHACPIGRKYRYQPAQAEWHMRAFRG